MVGKTKLLTLLVILYTLICALILISHQNIIRWDANYPQVQHAEDDAEKLLEGQQIFPFPSIDISTSLSPFEIIYQKNGVVTSSSGTLHGSIPQLPPGILTIAHEKGESRFTWQPANDVRIAAVVVANDKGFVLVGRNLREIEKHEDLVFNTIFLFWCGGIGIIVIYFFFIRKKDKVL